MCMLSQGSPASGPICMPLGVPARGPCSNASSLFALTYGAQTKLTDISGSKSLSGIAHIPFAEISQVPDCNALAHDAIQIASLVKIHLPWNSLIVVSAYKYGGMALCKLYVVPCTCQILNYLCLQCHVSTCVERLQLKLFLCFASVYQSSTGIWINIT